MYQPCWTPAYGISPGIIDELERNREQGIFDLVQDTRSIKRKFWSGFAGLVLNLLLLTGFAVLWQISALRQASAQLGAELRKELRHYRIVLIAPRIPRPAPQSAPKPDAAPRAHEPPAIPDPRILRGLDPALAGFVSDNPGLESIATRELVRDIDSGTLDLHALLEKSSMQVSFEIDPAGHIQWRKIDRSSRVPSIDHLALELVQLLDKYQLLGFISGVERIVASIRVDQRIDVSLEGRISPQAHIDVIRGQVEAALILWRMLVPEDDAGSYLQDVSIITQGDRIKISKSYDKDTIVGLLKQYYQPSPAK